MQMLDLLFFFQGCIYYKAAQYAQVQDTISQRIQFHKGYNFTKFTQLQLAIYHGHL